MLKKTAALPLSQIAQDRVSENRARLSAERHRRNWSQCKCKL